MLFIDALAVDGFINTKGVPSVLTGVDCLGSEVRLGMCPSTIATADCDTVAGVTCGRSSCKV